MGTEKTKEFLKKPFGFLEIKRVLYIFLSGGRTQTFT